MDSLRVASAPALGMRWWAGRGLGAFRDGERITVSSVSDVADAQLSFAWDTSERFHALGIGNRMIDLSHRCWRTRGYLIASPRRWPTARWWSGRPPLGDGKCVIP